MIERSLKHPLSVGSLAEEQIEAVHDATFRELGYAAGYNLAELEEEKSKGNPLFPIDRFLAGRVTHAVMSHQDFDSAIELHEGRKRLRDSHDIFQKEIGTMLGEDPSPLDQLKALKNPRWSPFAITVASGDQDWLEGILSQYDEFVLNHRKNTNRAFPRVDIATFEKKIVRPLSGGSLAIFAEVLKSPSLILATNSIEFKAALATKPLLAPLK